MGFRILESAYIDAVNKKTHPFFGGFVNEDGRFLDITIPVTTTKKDAIRRAKGKIQDLIIGISENGDAKPERILPKIKLPKQGSEPLF